MSPAALALALSAALLHALWNLLLAKSADTRRATAVALWAGLAVLAPVALARWRVEPEAWPFVAASAALEAVYFLLLAHAYAHAELSLVYPISRGLAPVLVLVASVALGSSVAPAEVLGVLSIASGVLLVRGWRRGSPGYAWIAVAIAGCIAAYSLVDQAGVRHAERTSYAALVLLPAAVVATALAIRGGTGDLRAALTPGVVLAGPLMVAAFSLVLAALELGPAGPVVAVRETSVVIATILAAVALRERVGRVRVAGSVAVAAGIAALALG